MDKKKKKDLEEMISEILSNKPDKPYEGFSILEKVADNKMSKEDLIAAINVIEELIFIADKKTRDEKYLFSKGLFEFNKAFIENKNNPDFYMTQEQKKKVRDKMRNLDPLIKFVLKVKDVIKENN